MSEQAPPSYGQASNPAPVTVGQPPVQPPAGAAQPQVLWNVGPNGQPQMYYGLSPSTGMQPFLQPAFQAVSYQPVQPAMQPVTTALPPSLQPYSFLALSLTVLIVCGILNITSLAFGIPALILSMQSEEKKRNYQYESAKKSGAIGLTLSVINITYTFFTITLAIGLGLGLTLQDCYDNYNCY